MPYYDIQVLRDGNIKARYFTAKQRGFLPPLFACAKPCIVLRRNGLEANGGGHDSIYLARNLAENRLPRNGGGRVVLLT